MSNEFDLELELAAIKDHSLEVEDTLADHDTVITIQAQKLMEALRSELKKMGVDTLVGLTAANDEAQSFYRKVPDSVMRDVGIWIDIR